MNKRVFIALLLCTCTLYSFAQTKFVKPRNQNEVVVITRIDTNANLHEDFFMKYYDIKSVYLKGKRPKKEDMLKTSVFFELVNFKRAQSIAPLQEDKFSFIFSRFRKDRTITFTHTEIHLVGNKQLRIYLPFNFEIVIPEGTQYVYMGSFNYELEGIQYKVKNVTSFDEFEKAEAFVKENYGEDAELVRVPVTVIE